MRCRRQTNSWLVGVRHIERPGPYRHNKDANLIAKVLRICYEKDLSDAFVRFSDDQYLLRQVEATDFKCRSRGDLASTTSWPQSDWWRRLKRTYEALRAAGKPTENYESHVPVTYSKRRFREVMLRYDYGYCDGYTINTLYFNNTMSDAPSSLDASWRSNSCRALQEQWSR